MKASNVFWGVFFILAAVAIILNQLGLLVGISLINLIITIFMISIIIKSIKYINFSGILIPLAIIGILYSDKLGIQALTPWPLLGSAVFLSIGLSFLIKPKQYFWENDNHKMKSFDDKEFVEGSEKGEVGLYNRFSESIKYINSKNLKKVNIDCSFGGMKVYFDNSKIEENEAILYIDASFAGIELYVPKEWNIINNVNCIFGGIDEKNKKEKLGDKNLILKGKVSFAGVEIIYI